MANVRDSDTSLWLHNKLGTSSDSWISGSICSQLNKEVLRNIKDCFPDLQTQVKLKLLLSFFHIPRRLVEEWKSELDDIVEVAGADSELWVSMTAETMKTFPATGQLNTEICDYDETRPIFIDMVTDLRKAVGRHFDFEMLPLECQYLNKNALISVVGQQSPSTKHFTLKRKPKSANLRIELLQKSADAQSSLKKSSAPTIPLRSRGMPRKMTDTTPLKGIPSRVPTSGFRSPTANQSQSRPNISRNPAGRKDGGIKLIEFTEQPLGYAASKKRKRQQELEEQQKKNFETRQSIQQHSPVEDITTSTPTPDYAAGLTASSIYTQSGTSSSNAIKDELLGKVSSGATTTVSTNVSHAPVCITAQSPVKVLATQNEDTKPAEEREDRIEVQSGEILSNQSLTSSQKFCSERSGTMLTRGKQGTSLPDTYSVTLKPSQEKKYMFTSTQQVKDSVVHIPKSCSGPIILSQTIIHPAKVTQHDPTIPQKVTTLMPASPSVPNSKQVTHQSSLVGSNLNPIPTLASITETRPTPTLVQTQDSIQLGQQTRIVLKTAQNIPVVMKKATRITNNPPPLIATQQQTLLNVNLPNRPVTIQPASQAAQVQHIQSQLQQQQHLYSHQDQPRTVVNNSTVQAPKFAQVVMSPGVNVKGKTIILAQKGVILRSVGGDVYQQIPLSNVSGLGNLAGATIVTTGSNSLGKHATQSIGQSFVKSNSSPQLPALIPTNNIAQNVNIPVVITSHNISQQQPQTMQSLIGSSPQQTIIRPVLATNLQSSLTALPQGLTLIQRSTHQPQFVQVPNRSHIEQQQPNGQRTIAPHSLPEMQMSSQRIIIQQTDRQTMFPAHQQMRPQQVEQQQPQRKGLSLSNEHAIKAHEMFRKANRVNRPDKALILGFMAGLRENPRPNAENVIVIKLGESEEHVKQEDNTSALMLVESLIRLDYNSGEWKTFQNFRRLGQPSQMSHQSNQDPDIKQQHNSVVI